MLCFTHKIPFISCGTHKNSNGAHLFKYIVMRDPTTKMSRAMKNNERIKLCLYLC